MRSLAVLATLTVLVAPAAAQNAKAERAARAHYQKGTKHFNAKQYAKAVTEYRAAYALVPRPALLFNIARALHENGDRREALEHYRRYLAEAPNDGVADEAREYVASLEAALSTPAPAEPAAPPAERADAPPPERAAPEPAAPPRTEPASPATGAATGGEITSTTSAVASPVRGRLRAGGLAGVTLANIAYDDWNGSTRVGLAAGAFASYRMVPAFAVRLEAAYVQKGTGDDPDFEEFWHTDFIQAALLAQGLVGHVHAGLGPYAAVRVSKNTPFDDELKSVDVGLLAGAGVALPAGPARSPSICATSSACPRSRTGSTPTTAPSSSPWATRPAEQVSDDVALQRLQHGLHAIAHAELGEDARHVHLHRALGGAQGLGDLAVAVAAGDEAHDLGLATGERLVRRRHRGAARGPPRALQQLLGQRGREEGRAAGEGADGAHQRLERDVLAQVTARAGAHTGQQGVAIVEGGEQQAGRRLAPEGELVEDLDATPARHAHVEDPTSISCSRRASASSPSAASARMSMSGTRSSSVRMPVRTSVSSSAMSTRITPASPARSP